MFRILLNARVIWLAGFPGPAMFSPMAASVNAAALISPRTIAAGAVARRASANVASDVMGRLAGVTAAGRPGFGRIKAQEREAWRLVLPRSRPRGRCLRQREPASAAPPSAWPPGVGRWCEAAPPRLQPGQEHPCRPTEHRPTCLKNVAPQRELDQPPGLRSRHNLAIDRAPSLKG